MTISKASTINLLKLLGISLDNLLCLLSLVKASPSWSTLGVKTLPTCCLNLYLLANFKIVNVKTTGILIIIIAVVFIIVILATFFFLMRLSLFIYPASQGLDIMKTSLSSWPLIIQGVLSKQPLFPHIETLSSLVIQHL